jgi:hypothetical protein
MIHFEQQLDLQSARCIVQKEKTPSLTFREQSAQLSIKNVMFTQLMDIFIVSLKLLYRS